jgi:hypothetical protein
MKKIVLCSLVVVLSPWLFIQGCTTMYWEPNCGDRAVYVASVVSKHYPVRLVPGTLNKEGHVEAQAKIDGEWQYIILVELDFKSDIVEPRREMPGFVPAGKSLTLLEYLAISGWSTAQ